MTITKGIVFTKDQIIDLYNNVGWSSYLENKNELWKAIENSLASYCMFLNDRIIGYARILGDGITTIIIQDLLIRTEYQGIGRGSELLRYILEEYKTIRQIYVVCDDQEHLNQFYEKNGFIEIQKYKERCYAIFH